MRPSANLPVPASFADTEIDEYRGTSLSSSCSSAMPVDWTLLYWTQRWFTDSDFLGESWTRSTSVSFARFSISRALVLLVSLSDSEAACFIHGAAELVPVAQHP